ncbi:MAG: regulatory protein RecX, partial [Coriobacteriia bacterium]
AIVGAFERTGLVDDHRFAESLVRSLLARGYGARRIERELARAGVEEALIAEVLDQAATPDIERERALEMAERMVRSAPDVRKLAGRLARKGFGADTSFWAARQALAAFVRDPGADD